MATMATKPSLLEELPSSRMAPSRLHNFTFPTPGWGSGLALRCIKDSPDVAIESLRSSEKVPSPSRVQSISTERVASPEAAENVELPWNLRRRRAAFYKGGSSKSLPGALGKAKRKLSVSLSLKEVEEDFLLMNGKKPLKRPKKRPKHVQKQIDAVFPGMWLSEVTPDLYKVE